MNGWEVLNNISNNISIGMGHLVEGLGTILNTVGQVVQHIYLVLVRQQVILGLQQLLWGILYLIGTIIAILTLKKVARKTSWAPADKWAVVVILVLVAVWLTYQGAGRVIGSLPQLLNPEYYAIQDGVRIYREVKP